MSSHVAVFVCLFSVLAGIAEGQSQGEPPSSKPTSQRASLVAPKSAPKQVDGHLVRVETIVSPSETIYAFQTTRCDSDGNIYLQTTAEAVQPVHKLNPKGERIAVFDPGADPDLKVDLAQTFALSEDGSELYQLVFPHEINRYVYVYRSDGTFKSAVKLQPGFVITPYKLAVFPSGQFLVTGLKYDRDKTATMLPFTGIFASDGRILKELELEDDKSLHDTAASGDTRVTSGRPYSNWAIAKSEVQIGADGNAYLMRWTSPPIFYAISPGGEVVRRFTIDPGDSTLLPMAMQLYQNRMAIAFAKKGDAITKVSDLEGHEIASYDLPPTGRERSETQLGGSLACYSENPTRLVFIGSSDDSRVQFWIAEAK